MSTTIYQGQVAPDAYVMNVTPGTSGLDLSTVTAASLEIELPDGTEVTWTATRSNQTTTTLRLTHVLASGDTPQIGTYRVYGALTVSGGTQRTDPETIEVLPEFGA